MGCGDSRLSCCKPPKKRCQGPDQPPKPELQELGPLNGDTATTVHLCASEEAGQHQKALTRILQQHEEDKKKWAQKVEKERELELGEKLNEQRRVLEGEHAEALRVLQASHEQDKEALTCSFQEAKAALQSTSSLMGQGFIIPIPLPSPGDHRQTDRTAGGLPGQGEEGRGVHPKSGLQEAHPGVREPQPVLGAGAGELTLCHRDEERANPRARQAAHPHGDSERKKPAVGGENHHPAAGERGPPCPRPQPDGCVQAAL
ncbi:coiled-coil domain-containing protein 69 isoform X2 [Orcinus orca]|uniref:coiled-coil domain-containing protein 69 isoform X2 n=1 Tax=Orcinus orca TaxID=9733 RepID=UPI002112850D|nr:coiled-coil domain-containing protein 69 isoform X2 [Orcinus orca]